MGENISIIKLNPHEKNENFYQNISKTNYLIFKDFVQKLVHQKIIPSIQNRILNLNDLVSPHRTNNLISSKLQSFFKIMSSNSNSSEQQKIDQIPYLTRQLADLYLFIGDYENALVNYEYLLLYSRYHIQHNFENLSISFDPIASIAISEYQKEKGIPAKIGTNGLGKYKAGAQEMIAMLNIILETRTDDIERKLTKAIQIFKLENMHRNCYRIYFLLILFKKLQRNYEDAAAICIIFDKHNQNYKKDNYLSAILNEQAAFCYLYQKKSFRNFSFRLFTAGEKYFLAGHVKHSLGCFLSVKPMYENWNYLYANILDHICLLSSLFSVSNFQIESYRDLFNSNLNSLKCLLFKQLPHSILISLFRNYLYFLKEKYVRSFHFNLLLFYLLLLLLYLINIIKIF